MAVVPAWALGLLGTYAFVIAVNTANVFVRGPKRSYVIPLLIGKIGLWLTAASYWFPPFCSLAATWGLAPLALSLLVVVLETQHATWIWRNPERFGRKPRPMLVRAVVVWYLVVLTLPMLLLGSLVATGRCAAI